ATGLVISDALPNGLTYVSDNPSAGSYDSGTGAWTLGGLANGASATLEIVATLTQNGSITNTAAVTAVDQPDSDAGNDTASQTLSGTQADIAVSKSVSAAETNVDTDVTFTVTVTNNGPDDATGIEVTDQLPAGLAYDSHAAGQGAYTAATGLWAVGALANGATATLEIIATVTGTETVTNTASVTASDQADPEVENNLSAAQVTGLEVDIAVTKTVDNASPALSSNVVFTVTATNNGPSDATGLALTDLLPAGLTYVSDTPSQGGYTSGTGLWSVGALANGASATLAITATVAAEGTTTNTATVTALDQPDPNAGNDSASQAVTTPMGGTLEGTVLDVAFDESSGKTEAFAGLVETPLEGALVDLLLDGASVASTTTGTDGTFSFDLSGKTKGLAYELRFLASGTVPETASAVEARKTVAAVTEGTYTYRLPLALAIQKLSLVYALENLAVPGSLLLSGGASPVPLPVVYSEAATTALMSTWLADVGVNRTQIVESMARLLIAEMVLSDLYNNAIWMSHETASTMFSLIRGFLITQGIALEIQDGFRTRVSNRIGRAIAQRHIAIMNRYIQRLFLEEPAKLAIASLPADCLPMLQDALLAILGTASNADLLDNVGNTALYDGLIVEGDKILAGWYVSETQPELDDATTRAEAFDYTATAGEAHTAVQSIIGTSDAATSAASAEADALRAQSNIGQVIDKVLTHRDRTLNLGNLVSMYRQLRQARFAVLARSVVVTVTRLKHIEAQEAPEGTFKAFHPAAAPLAVETSSSLQAAEAVSSPALERLTATSDAYRQALDDVVTAFTEGRRSEAIGQFASILDLDEQLASDLFAAQAPVVAAAENASAQVAGFDDAFGALTDRVAGNGLERTIFYTQLLQIADDDQYPADSLAMQADSVKTSLAAAETGITDATGLVQGIDARPYVAVSELAQERDKVGAGDTLRITATVKNLGASNADDVVVTLTADAAALVISQAAFTIGTLAPDEAQTFAFELEVVDATQAVRGYQVDLSSSNALVVPANGSYNVGVVVGVEEIAAEIPTSYGLSQSYPNPFNPQTTITFSVPASGAVTIHVFDILGREVSRLVDEVVAPGTFHASFDGGDLPSGTYFYRMQAGDFTAVRSMILVK
ncbi:MAG: DUF11 domain-containing protein, partial [Gemmatimonadetes bacterium]|nr:DUF11 domain-containing protein [Gemmatimonadota bacterium]